MQHNGLPSNLAGELHSDLDAPQLPAPPLDANYTTALDAKRRP